MSLAYRREGGATKAAHAGAVAGCREIKFGIIFANVGPYVQPGEAIAMGTLGRSAGQGSRLGLDRRARGGAGRLRIGVSVLADRAMPGPEETPIPDPLIWLTWVGAATTTLGLATGILILPQRNPVVLAKELTTLDVLSGGRVELGVGVGWLREEFDALGIPFEERAPAPTSRRGVTNAAARGRGPLLRDVHELRSGQELPQAGAEAHPDPRRRAHHGRGTGAPADSVTGSSPVARRTRSSRRCSRRCGRRTEMRDGTRTRSR